MIVSRQRLIQLARDEATRRAERNGILAAYLVGSVVDGEPMFAGAADIDVVLVHRSTPAADREFVPLSDDVHLDLVHFHRDQFAPPRSLRVDPDMVPAMCNAIRLVDPDHFFDWAQAGACARHDRPDYRLKRSQACLTRARARQHRLAQDHGWQQPYARAAIAGLNALACLSGPPHSGRRQLVDLRRRLADDGRHQALADFYGLFDLPDAGGLDLPQWLSGWAKAFDRVHSNGGQARAFRVRRDYHLRAFQELADLAGPEVIIPCLIDLWPAPLPDQPDETLQALATDLGVAAEHLQPRQSQLDAFLDSIELALGAWAEEYGI